MSVFLKGAAASHKKCTVSSVSKFYALSRLRRSEGKWRSTSCGSLHPQRPGPPHTALPSASQCGSRSQPAEGRPGRFARGRARAEDICPSAAPVRLPPPLRCRGPRRPPLCVAVGRALSEGFDTSGATMSRSYNDELQYLDKIDKNCWRIKKGFVPNMHVRGKGGKGLGRGEGGSGKPGRSDRSPRRWREFST